MELNLGFVLFAILMGYLVVVRPVMGLLRDRKAHLASQDEAEKAEALFRATFPELQPHFHPANVADYVEARVEKGLKPAGGIIDDPPGFPAAVRARVAGTAKGERTVLEDSAGAKLAEFMLEPKEGALGAVRLGAGKFTVRRKLHQAPSVKYWHPDREFEWSPPANWKFTTRLADEPIGSSDRGTTWSDSSSSTSRTAAAFAGAGGTFDGGGASAGWDASAAGGESPSESPGASEGAGSSGAGGAGESTSTSY
jgi:hypothetical protein